MCPARSCTPRAALAAALPGPRSRSSRRRTTRSSDDIMGAVTVTTVPTLNPPRENPLVAPAIFDRLRDLEGVSKVVMPSGDEAWLVTRHDLVREVLTSPAMSSAFFHLALLAKDASVEDRIPGMFNRMDAPDHTRYRKVLQRAFTAPGVAKLRPVIEALAQQALEECADAGPAVD